MHALRRPLMDAKGDASLYRFTGEEAFHVSSELRHLFSTGRSRITIHCLIDDGLRKVGVEVSCSALSNQDGRVAIGPEVFAVRLPQRTTSRVGRTDSDQWALGCCQRRTCCIQNFNIGIRTFVAHPERTLIRKHSNTSHASDETMRCEPKVRCRW